MNPNLVSKMETYLEEFQGIRIKEFTMWIKFQDQILHCNQIGHHINECPFIENNVRQGFVKHIQNLNLELAKVGNHGHIMQEDRGSEF